jgi:prepilin-type N-terminal cleavage/methylation domain-containing protein
MFWGLVCERTRPVLNQVRSEKDHKNVIEQGFTLVELLIVIVILGILAGIVVFAVGNLTSNAKTNACATEKATISTALEAYKANTGVYPTAAAAGGGAHTAMDLLDGVTAAPAGVGTLLKSAPADYKVDDSGNISLIANPSVNGCTS